MEKPIKIIFLSLGDPKLKAIPAFKIVLENAGFNLADIIYDPLLSKQLELGYIHNIEKSNNTSIIKFFDNKMLITKNFNKYVNNPEIKALDIIERRVR